jgi:hypothetical protein
VKRSFQRPFRAHRAIWPFSGGCAGTALPPANVQGSSGAATSLDLKARAERQRFSGPEGARDISRWSSRPGAATGSDPQKQNAPWRGARKNAGPRLLSFTDSTTTLSTASSCGLCAVTFCVFWGLFRGFPVLATEQILHRLEQPQDGALPVALGGLRLSQVPGYRSRNPVGWSIQ